MIRAVPVLLILLLAAMVPTPVAAQMFDDPEAPAPVPRYDPDGEAMRSVILPGWSQFRQGHDGVGFAYATVAAVCALFMTGVVEVPLLGDEEDNFSQVFGGMLYGLNAAASGFDAYRRASESNRENGWDLDEQASRGYSGIRLSLVRIRF